MKSQQENLESLKKLTMQFLAEAIGQCPAGLESSSNQDIVFAVIGFQYGAVQSAAQAAGLDDSMVAEIATGVVSRINGIDGHSASRFISVMPMLAGKGYPPVEIGARAIISFYSATSDQERIGAASSLSDLLRQIEPAES